MNPLPVEVPCWLENFRAKVKLESSVVKALIRWGLTEHAFDIHKRIEGRVNQALESSVLKSASCFRLTEEDRKHIREMLREHYMKTRDLLDRCGTRERLHNGLLTGFEELSTQLIGHYEDYVRGLSGMASREKAA